MDKKYIWVILITITTAAYTQTSTLEWAKRIGGTSDDFAFSICLDAAGNVYTTGCFNDTVDFDPGVGISNLISNGGADIFIQKLDANGNFLWA